MHPERTTVWCGFWAGGVIGPFFFEDDEGVTVTINGERYRHMLTNFLWPFLQNIDMQNLWFQQDGATCHNSRETIEIVKEKFPGRLISLRVELSGVSEINSDGDDPDFDMVSHISASTDGDFAPTACGQGCPSIHTNDRQWRDDDNVVDDFMFNPDITNSVKQLLKKETVDVDSSLQTIKHQLEVVGKSRCYMCYSIMSQSKGRNYAQSHSTKVQTKCLACNKYYCLKCFFKNHKITK
ncbi:uncharacterized protein LOC132940126 [Metopolophium dirhodum]|uniref:uncharacterized protein LOC132940126 n=1 Tax=Metopolophium dirhodum TaxID=44670 RepID=UPI00298FD049|nr:uncharacterized protein LOC132940126 [Metopolophium dirhodum]